MRINPNNPKKITSEQRLHDFLIENQLEITRKSMTLLEISNAKGYAEWFCFGDPNNPKPPRQHIFRWILDTLIDYKKRNDRFWRPRNENQHAPS